MFKNCTVINKNTNEIFEGQIDTELENLAEYPFRETTESEILNYNIASLKKSKITKISNCFEDSFLNGLETSLTDSSENSIKVHVKEKDQLNYIGIMTAIAGLADTDLIPIDLIDFNGNLHKLTKVEFNTVYFEVLNFKAQQESKHANLITQINSVSTIEELENINWE